jgi:hypothetical protein
MHTTRPLGTTLRPLRGMLVLLALATLAVSVPLVASAKAPPPGATARCRDGTYSYSKHRRGTCSHHGGVAEWLSGGSSSTATSRARSQAESPVPARLATVLLARRRRTSGCKLGPSPDRRCSPGAYYEQLTKAVICSPGFRTSAIRNVPESEKDAVKREYGLPERRFGSALEIDHIVSLELGGSNDIANLFPELANAHPGYRVKDRLENRLHDLVCSGAMSLAAARTQIAADWQALYEKVFGVPAAG